MVEKINLNLPEFVWLSGGEHERGGDPLINREIILHTPSAAIVEILIGENYIIPKGKVSFKFTSKKIDDTLQVYTALLHNYEVDNFDDTVYLQESIMKPLSHWYSAYWNWAARRSYTC